MTEKVLEPPYDALDRQIIEALLGDARARATEVARSVGAHERTVRKRIERLVEGNAIRFAAIVNPRAFGYVAGVHLILEVNPENEEKVVAGFQDMQQIAYMAYGLDDRNILLLQAHFRDNDEMREFLRHTLPAIPGIHVISSILISRTLRQHDSWSPQAEDFHERTN
jgi:DNA-binding Lrp family transcriptional regulator